MRKPLGILLMLLLIGGQAVEAQRADAGIRLKAYQRALASGNQEEAKSELVAAKEYIDEAMEKEADDPKTWYYAGEIYMGFFFLASDPEVQEKYITEENIKKGLDAYKHHIQMDKKRKDDMEEEIRTKMYRFRAMFLNQAASFMQNQQDSLALGAYQGSIQLMDVVGEVDSVSYFNGGIMAENLGNWEVAEEFYGKAAEVDFAGNIAAPRYAKALYKNGKEEEAYAAMEKGAAKYGSDKDFITEEVNFYLLTGDNEKAKGAVTRLIDTDPNNPQLHFIAGTIYDESGQFEEALNAYDKALEIEPDYFDANFNRGVMLYNRGADKLKEVESIDDFALMKEETEKAKEFFKDAVPYMEKCHELDPKERNTINVLKTLYLQLRMNDKAQEMNEKLKNL